MPLKRTQYPDSVKKRILEELRSGSITIREIEAKYGATKYQVERWQARFIALAMEQGHDPEPIVPVKSLSNGNGNGHHKVTNGNGNGHERSDPRDRLIMQLQIKVANQAIEIDRLKALVHGGKRFSDKELYSDDHRGE
jgi:hypothetical protein